MSVAGYSGTPLARKLGFKDGGKVFLENPPPNYRTLIAPARIAIASSLGADTDIAHLFVTRRARLAAALRNAREVMRPDAAVWVSWPKKSSKVPTDVTEDTIREVALPLGLVDIKVCAVDDTWSGLKLVVRRKNRKLA